MMYRVCVQTGNTHMVICEGSYAVCLEAYNTYADNGIVYIQRRTKDNTCDNDVLNYNWRGIGMERNV
jgi:hypothetical protein